MLVLINKNIEKLSISDYETEVKGGSLLNVSDNVAKKIVTAGYGISLEIEDLDAKYAEKIAKKEEVQPYEKITSNEIKDILTERKIEFNDKADKKELYELYSAK